MFDFISLVTEPFLQISWPGMRPSDSHCADDVIAGVRHLNGDIIYSISRWSDDIIICEVHKGSSTGRAMTPSLKSVGGATTTTAQASADAVTTSSWWSAGQSEDVLTRVMDRRVPGMGEWWFLLWAPSASSRVLNVDACISPTPEKVQGKSSSWQPRRCEWHTGHSHNLNDALKNQRMHNLVLYTRNSPCITVNTSFWLDLQTANM